MRRESRWLAVLAVLWVTAVSAAAAAEAPSGFQLQSELRARAIPEGLQLATDAGYQWGLFDSDSKLLEDTYFEAGLTNTTTPSNIWGGVYLESIPVAVLELRASAQFMGYFGNFGYLHVPGNSPQQFDEGEWNLDALDVSDDRGLGVSTTGWKFTGEATPRAKVGPVVAMVPFEFTHVRMNVDRPYYESSFDWLLEPNDTYWRMQPTLGYVFSFEKADSWLLTGVRWEHGATFGRGLKRDLGTLLALWKLPGQWWPGKEMKFALLGGTWFQHPNRGYVPYIAGSFSVQWLSPAAKAAGAGSEDSEGESAESE